MLISHEIPKALFPYHHLINDYPYVLSHLIQKDKEYAEFYKRILPDYKYSILDCSTFELGKSVDHEELYENAKEYQPKILVLPDTLHDMKATLDASTEFIRKYKENLNRLGINLMGVVQGADFNELHNCFRSYVRLDVRSIAIPFDCIKNSDWHTIRLIYFKDLLKSYEVPYSIHFLGIINPSELLLYTKEEKNKIFSIDTSSPIINGWLGQRYGEFGLASPKPTVKLADSLDIELKSNQIENIVYNVKKFRGYAEN